MFNLINHGNKETGLPILDIGMLKLDKRLQCIDFLGFIKVVVVFFLFSFYPIRCKSQTPIVDSLESLVINHTDSEVKLKALLRLMIRTYPYTDLDKCFNSIPKAIALANETGNDILGGQTRVDISYLYILIGEIDSAQMFLDLALPFVKRSDDDNLNWKFHTIHAQCHTRNGNHAQALSHYQKALASVTDSTDHTNIGASLQNIGLIYKDRNQYTLAEPYFRDAIIHLRKGSNSFFLANALYNLAIITDNMEEHESNYLEAVDIYRSYNSTVDVAEAECMHAQYLLKRGQLDSVPVLIYRSREVLMEKAPPTCFECMIALIQAQVSSCNSREARESINWLDNYIEQQQLPLTLSMQILYNKGRSDFYKCTGEYENAYDYLSITYDLFDSLEYSQDAEYTSEFQVKYETAEKEKQLAEKELVIAKEKNKRNRQLLIGLGLISLIGLGGLFFFNQQRKRKREAQHALQLQAVETESIKSLSEMKSRWFENISHDIRTPLTLISAPIKDALKATKPSNTKNLLEIADRNSQHLLQLTSEMLELARLENQVIPLHPKSKPTAFELQKIINAFDSYAQDLQVDVQSTIHFDDEQVLEFDYDKYEKVFNNLLKNALQYSPPQSTINVDVSLHSNTLMTSIRDEGPGIPENEINYLFDKYFRASHQQSQRVEGSGLGLAIVHELLALLNGKIDVTSAINHGSTFSFQIPVQTQKEYDASDVIEPVEYDSGLTPQYDLGQSRILLVEDNAEMRNYLAQTLTPFYSIVTAENAHIALRHLDSASFDLIISDIMMPGMDGFDFKKRVNSLSQHEKTPFIFLSARALDEDKLTGLNLGVDDYITKPFITEELLVRIKNLLTHKFIREEAQNTNSAPDDAKPADSSFVDQAINIVQQHIQEEDFSVEQLAEKLHYSQRQLNRLLKKETGLTAVQFILEIRLLQARKLLLSNQVYSVKEVQFQVGILSQSYFSRKYKERFGVTPGHILK